MTDRERVIIGLEICRVDKGCEMCPYDEIGITCQDQLMEDALALLKAQKDEGERMTGRLLVTPMNCGTCTSRGKDGKCVDRRSVHFGTMTAQEEYCRYWEE